VRRHERRDGRVRDLRHGRQAARRPHHPGRGKNTDVSTKTESSYYRVICAELLQC
jgi:hypothetical protein